MAQHRNYARAAVYLVEYLSHLVFTEYRLNSHRRYPTFKIENSSKKLDNKLEGTRNDDNYTLVKIKKKQKKTPSLFSLFVYIKKLNLREELMNFSTGRMQNSELKYS